MYLEGILHKFCNVFLLNIWLGMSMYAQKISSSFVLSTWFTISFSSKSSNSYCYSDSFTFPVLTYSVHVQKMCLVSCSATKCTCPSKNTLSVVLGHVISCVPKIHCLCTVLGVPWVQVLCSILFFSCGYKIPNWGSKSLFCNGSEITFMLLVGFQKSKFFVYCSLVVVTKFHSSC